MSEGYKPEDIDSEAGDSAKAIDQGTTIAPTTSYVYPVRSLLSGVQAAVESSPSPSEDSCQVPANTSLQITEYRLSPAVTVTSRLHQNAGDPDFQDAKEANRAGRDGKNLLSVRFLLFFIVYSFLQVMMNLKWKSATGS